MSQTCLISPEVQQFHKQGKTPRFVAEATGMRLSNVRECYSMLNSVEREDDESDNRFIERQVGDSRNPIDPISGKHYTVATGCSKEHGNWYIMSNDSPAEVGIARDLDSRRDWYRVAAKREKAMREQQRAA